VRGGFSLILFSINKQASSNDSLNLAFSARASSRSRRIDFSAPTFQLSCLPEQMPDTHSHNSRTVCPSKFLVSVLILILVWRFGLQRKIKRVAGFPRGFLVNSLNRFKLMACVLNLDCNFRNRFRRRKEASDLTFPDSVIRCFDFVAHICVRLMFHFQHHEPTTPFDCCNIFSNNRAYFFAYSTITKKYRCQVSIGTRFALTAT